MERRGSIRISLDAPALVQVVGQGTVFEGRVKDVSARGIAILLSHPFAPGTTVRVDLPDTMVLGEVCHCQPEAGGAGYTLGIQVEEILHGLTELARLMSQLVLTGVAAGSTERAG